MDRESYLELESILRDIKANRAKPCHLPFEFLKCITDNFSADLQLGRGGFGVVYKGVLKYGERVVVKRLRAALGILDEQYEKESRLLSLKHENIVRILGFCSEAQKAVVKHEGRDCLADILERLICLEYVPNGSLDCYIEDASSGLNWDQRHKIILGICYGLHFLHEENQTNTPIIHLDLKPANILLTNEMVPKITDFGLSRLFGEQQTRIYTKNKIGTCGYMAPEFVDRGKITKKSDIFSFGVIVLEIITGNRDYPWSNDTTVHQNYVENEVQKWRKRMTEDLNSVSVENSCRQVKKCIEIGLKCVNTDEMKRPTTEEIIECLNRLPNSNCPKSSTGGEYSFDAFRQFLTSEGGEYLFDAFCQFLTSEGILAQLSCPSAHTQNGVAEGIPGVECLNRGLNESAFAVANIGPSPSLLTAQNYQDQEGPALPIGMGDELFSIPPTQNYQEIIANVGPSPSFPTTQNYQEGYVEQGYVEQDPYANLQEQYYEIAVPPEQGEEWYVEYGQGVTVNVGPSPSLPTEENYQGWYVDADQGISANVGASPNFPTEENYQAQRGHVADDQDTVANVGSSTSFQSAQNYQGQEWYVEYGQGVTVNVGPSPTLLIEENYQDQRGHVADDQDTTANGGSSTSFQSAQNYQGQECSMEYGQVVTLNVGPSPTFTTKENYKGQGWYVDVDQGISANVGASPSFPIEENYQVDQRGHVADDQDTNANVGSSTSFQSAQNYQDQGWCGFLKLPDQGWCVDPDQGISANVGANPSFPIEENYQGPYEE